MKRWWRCGEWRKIFHARSLAWGGGLYLVILSFLFLPGEWLSIPEHLDNNALPRWVTSDQVPTGLIANTFLRQAVILFVLVAHAIHRRRQPNPLTDPGYRSWLANTPWSAARPLPLGPIVMVWQDAAMLLAVTAWATLDLACAGVLNLNTTDVTACLIDLLAASMLLFSIVFGTAASSPDPVIAWIGRAIWPLMVYPVPDVRLVLALLMVSQVLKTVGVHGVLREFPWREPGWTQTPVQQWRESSRDALGWPWNQTGPYTPPPEKSRLAAIAGTLLWTWWVFAVVHVWVGWGNGVTLWFGLVVLITAAVRWGRYAGLGAPPISLFGRLRYLRPIVPGYDRIFVSVWAILLAGYGLPWLVWWRGGSEPAQWAAMVLGMGTAGALLGPTLQQWQLTGQYNLRASQQRGSRGEEHWQDEPFDD
jgi:hypothetical protein